MKRRSFFVMLFTAIPAFLLLASIVTVLVQLRGVVGQL
jgi:hypothetical protein